MVYLLRRFTEYNNMKQNGKDKNLLKPGNGKKGKEDKISQKKPE